jgi:hypothetical protein
MTDSVTPDPGILLYTLRHDPVRARAEQPPDRDAGLQLVVDPQAGGAEPPCDRHRGLAAGQHERGHEARVGQPRGDLPERGRDAARQVGSRPSPAG